MKDLDLPAAVRACNLDEAASDARHICDLADVLMAGQQFRAGDPVPSVLWVIRDLAEILAWNLERLHTKQETRT